MKLVRLSCLLFIIALWACNTNTAKDTTVTVRDSVGVIADTTAVSDDVYNLSPGDTVLFGFYQGVLPCKDCQGIKHTLLLKDSSHFKLEEFILGKNTFPQKFEGRWVKAGDSLRLLSNREHIATYHIQKDTLRLSYREGNPITDSISRNYWIARQANAADNAAWRKRHQAGIDFYAIGNEPFWNLEIDNDRSVSFRIADLPKPIVTGFSKPRVDKDSTFYSITSGSTKLEITVYNEFCSDGMSDNIYEYRVHVRYKGETFKGCGLYFQNSKTLNK